MIGYLRKLAKQRRERCKLRYELAQFQREQEYAERFQSAEEYAFSLYDDYGPNVVWTWWRKAVYWSFPDAGNPDQPNVR